MDNKLSLLGMEVTRKELDLLADVMRHDGFAVYTRLLEMAKATETHLAPGVPDNMLREQVGAYNAFRFMLSIPSEVEDELEELRKADGKQ